MNDIRHWIVIGALLIFAYLVLSSPNSNPLAQTAVGGTVAVTKAFQGR